MYLLESGIHENLGNEEPLTIRYTVICPDVPWLQLYFDDFNLGKKSYVTITSLQDGGMQRFDSQTLLQWQNATAYFNGNILNIDLSVAPGETGIYFRIKEILVGEWENLDESADNVSAVDESLFQESQCGNSDDRVSARDRAIGRILPVGCTGWIISNGTFLTAGHCRGVNQVIQFNVPESSPNGTIVNPPPQDQYPIFYINSSNNGVGNDWALFKSGRNVNGELPIRRQEDFYRISYDLVLVKVRVTGYGVDSFPPGTTGGFNADNQTLQTNAGGYIGEDSQNGSNIAVEYTVDTKGGNSGSPVGSIDNKTALGIHTHGGCNSPEISGNKGTSFKQSDLQNAIIESSGANVKYVDKDHRGLSLIKDGTIFRPLKSIENATESALAGSTLSIVKGSYDEFLTINKALTLEAPVGTVTIGKKKN